MLRTRSLSLAAVFSLLFANAPLSAQTKPEVVERGKKATALVEVLTADGAATGSAFCIDRSGLFITNSHVVGDAARGEGFVRLVLDICRKTQRSVRAKVLRADDAVDLALLKVDADLGLTPLEIGKDDTLAETAVIITFGFPLGKATRVRNEAYPDATVLLSRVTALRKDQGRLEGIQFDNQLNPGNSGGPVLDEAGKVVGVAVATVRGAAMNLAIPVNRLVEFLEAPGLLFDPPPLTYADRARPVSWTIRVRPPTPAAKVPEGISVSVTVASTGVEPRTLAAQPLGGGLFKVTLSPVPRDPERKIDLDVTFASGARSRVQVKDGDVKVGGRKFALSDLSVLNGMNVPFATTTRGEMVRGPITGLGKVREKVGKKVVTLDLSKASHIMIRTPAPPPPVQTVEALAEAKRGSKVVATVHRVTNLTGIPVIVVRDGVRSRIVPVQSPSLILRPGAAEKTPTTAGEATGSGGAAQPRPASR